MKSRRWSSYIAIKGRKGTLTKGRRFLRLEDEWPNVKFYDKWRHTECRGFTAILKSTKSETRPRRGRTKNCGHANEPNTRLLLGTCHKRLDANTCCFWTASSSSGTTIHFVSTPTDEFQKAFVPFLVLTAPAYSLALGDDLSRAPQHCCRPFRSSTCPLTHLTNNLGSST